MRTFITKFSLIFLATGLFCAPCAWAFDLSKGLMYAVPAPQGSPAFDGSDKGWDLSGAEPIWMSTQLARQLHARVALDCDNNNLCV